MKPNWQSCHGINVGYQILQATMYKCVIVVAPLLANVKTHTLATASVKLLVYVLTPTIRARILIRP